MKYPFENYKDVNSFLDKVETNPNGHYPIGNSVFWHSGVHIFSNSQDEFSPILNGSVVCYRISEKYKQVKLPPSLSKEDISDKWSDYKDLYDEGKVYKLKSENSNKTYPISDCFIMLKHDVKIDKKNFTFYTLYMNLAPKCDYPEYTKDFIIDGQIHGSKIDSNEKEFFIEKIGKPAKNKKDIYFDYVLLSGENLKSFSSKKGVNAFWAIDKNTSFYTRTKTSNETPEKIFIPKWTEFDIEEYSDNSDKSYKVTIKSVQVYLGSSTQVQKGKLKDLSILTFSRGKGSENIIEPMDDKKYISNIVKAKVETLIDKVVDYYDRSDKNFWYIKVPLDSIEFWTKRKITQDDINSESAFYIEKYTRNPLLYTYQVKNDVTDDLRQKVIKINDTQISGVDKKNYYQLIFSGIEDYDLYVDETDKNKCYKSLLDFENWFYFYKESNSIICNRTDFVKSVINSHDELVKKSLLVLPVIGIWWTGAVLTWTFLQYMLGKKSSAKESQGGELTKLELRKVVCSHPIEWDKEQFKDISNNKTISKDAEDNLVNEATAIDLWNGGLNKIFNKNPYFYNPIYFIDHFEKANLFEFNPYEGKTLKKVTNTSYSTWYNFDGTNYDLTKKIESNPGFAPYDPELFSKYEINGYACINTLFMEKMDYEQNGITKKYSHEGIDFAGKRIASSKTDKKLRTPIHSFVSGIVVKTGNHKALNYGKHLIVSDGNNRLFLLGHLYDYADGIKVGSKISPGDTVAYVGNTGNCAGLSEESKKDGSGTHLHLTVYKTEKAKYISNQPVFQMSREVDDILFSDGTYKTHSCETYKNINPFNYKEERK